MKHFMAYWKPKEVEYHHEYGGLIGHAAGKQYKRTSVGDTVWLVTIRDGELFLEGKLVVGEITDWEGAVNRLGTSDFWEVDYHVFAAPDTAVPLRSVSLASIAQHLRFESSTGRDRLSFRDDGRITAQQLQTMRTLTPDTNDLLEDCWNENR